MAIIAIRAAGDMRRMFASRRDAIMAGATSANDLCMVNGHDGHKCERAVTIFADIAGLYVCGVFAGSGSAIVATHTIVDDTNVVEGSRQPAAGDMAVITLIAG